MTIEETLRSKSVVANVTIESSRRRALIRVILSLVFLVILVLVFLVFIVLFLFVILTLFLFVILVLFFLLFVSHRVRFQHIFE